MSERASYDLKLDRAEKHLVDLEHIVSAYCDSDPYVVRERHQGKKQRKVRRLHFTEQPDPEIALIVGDILYNIRSSLDHLAAAIVPSNDRRSVMFPVFWQGVWGPPVEGENEQRRRDRDRWTTYTAEISGIQGTTHVVIRAGTHGGGYRTAALREVALEGGRMMADYLRPFDRL